MPRDQTIWFAMIDGLESGPMTRGEFALRMAADRVNEETFVWKEGMSEWLPAARVRELAEMLPLGERVHQEEVAQELFSTGEHSRSGKTGAFAIDEVKWAYARSQKEPPPQDSKAAALARAIKATAVKPAEGALPAMARHP